MFRLDWIGWIITTVIMEVRSVIGAWGSLVREQRTVRDSLGLVLLLKHEEPENIHHRIATFVIDDSRLCLNPTSQSGESCPFPLRFVASFALVLVSSLSNTPSLVPHLILASRQQVASSRQQAASIAHLPASQDDYIPTETIAVLRAVHRGCNRRCY